MLIRYELDCKVVVVNGEFEMVATIYRQVGDGEVVVASRFNQRVNSATPDSTILAAAQRRFETYCQVDSDRIGKKDVVARAAALEIALSGLEYTA